MPGPFRIVEELDRDIREVREVRITAKKNAFIKRIHKAYRGEINPKLQREVLEAIRTGIFPSKFLSMVKNGPKIYGKILNYTPPGEIGSWSFFANPYSMAHQEPLIIKQNAQKLVSTENTRVVLLGPAYAQKDILFFQMAGLPAKADIVDISQGLGEIAKRAVIAAGTPKARLHKKNYMAGRNSVWNPKYYEKEIIRDDPRPIRILSFGHGQFNDGMKAYEESLSAMRAVMRPQDSFGMAANLTQHKPTLIAEYSEAVETSPKSKNYGTRLWELFGKSMLQGTVTRIAGCTNLDLNKISWLPLDMRYDGHCTTIRLRFSAVEHPKLKYLGLDQDVPYQFAPEIEFVKTPRPTEKLLRAINNRVGFKLAHDEMLRVQVQAHRIELQPDVVFMQVRPI